ncbi:MAG: FAD-dependent oxidoreductase [Cyanobacteria bacterium P01_G01_bin.49]
MISTSNGQKSCLIIGGGISGLIAGTTLQRNGINVTILDKGRGIGGRLATRRIPYPSSGQGVFDYGAQFFTISDPKFQVWVDQWLQQGVVKEWSKKLLDREQPCYRGVESNRSLAKHLGKDLEVHLSTRVTKLIWDTSHWTVETEKGDRFDGDSLIMTPPVPQSLALLNKSNIPLPSPLKSHLEQVNYYPCITVLLLLAEPSLIPKPGGLRLQNPSLAWLCCNHKKGISPQGFAVTLHATPEFSETYWDTDDSVVVKKLLKIASAWLGSRVVDYQIHRWRYSHPKTVYGELYLPLHQPGLLVMAGDAFSTMPSVDLSLTLEKATLSGLGAANYLLDQKSLNT